MNNYKNEILKHSLQINQADAFLFTSDVNRYWLTNFVSSYGFVIALPEKFLLFLDARYYQKAVDEIDNPQIEIILLKNKAQVAQTLASNKVHTLLVEQEYFSFNDYLFFEKSVTKIVNFPSDVLRIKKTNEEIEAIQKATALACETLNWLQNQNLIGYTEQEVANMVSIRMLSLGATKNSFDPIVASGTNGAYPHHKPTSKKIANDEFVTVDLGCIYDGYCSDVTRTFPIGMPSEQLIKAYQTVFAANELGIKAVQPNATGAEIDKICRDYISNSEFANYFNHATGHGVGINVHELPVVGHTYQKPLLAQSVITIEPGIYIPNVGGIRIEDMVLVTKTGYFLLSDHAKKWVF